MLCFIFFQLKGEEKFHRFEHLSGILPQRGQLFIEKCYRGKFIIRSYN